MATFHTRLAMAPLVPRSPPVTRTFTNTARCQWPPGERLLGRTQGENSSTGKNKLQRKRSKQSLETSPAGMGAGSAVPGTAAVAVGQGEQSRPHRGTWAAEQQGIVSLWPSEHGAVGTRQQVQAGQGMCGTSRV